MIIKLSLQSSPLIATLLVTLITTINNSPLFDEDEETDIELLNLTLTGNLTNYEENMTRINSKYENYSWPQQSDLVQIYSNPNFKPLEDGDLFQGDILLADADQVPSSNADQNGSSEVKTAVRIFNIWPLGIIPYTMDLSLRKYTLYIEV